MVYVRISNLSLFFSVFRAKSSRAKYVRCCCCCRTSSCEGCFHAAGKLRSCRERSSATRRDEPRPTKEGISFPLFALGREKEGGRKEKDRQQRAAVTLHMFPCPLLLLLRAPTAVFLLFLLFWALRTYRTYFDLQYSSHVFVPTAVGVSQLTAVQRRLLDELRVQKQYRSHLQYCCRQHHSQYVLARQQYGATAVGVPGRLDCSSLVLVLILMLM